MSHLCHNCHNSLFQSLQRSEPSLYKAGELLIFLLNLSPEQEKYATWSPQTSGPTLVKGGPGTGKSTVALYRIRSFLDLLLKAGHQSPFQV